MRSRGRKPRFTQFQSHSDGGIVQLIVSDGLTLELGGNASWTSVRMLVEKIKGRWSSAEGRDFSLSVPRRSFVTAPTIFTDALKLELGLKC